LIRMNHSQWLKEFYTIKELSQKALLDLGVPEDKNILEYKEKQLSLLLYWCELIFRLRQDEPEAWDEIYELYEDD
jgi:hypothetical protein